jgi:hypothetical protein
VLGPADGSQAGYVEQPPSKATKPIPIRDNFEDIREDIRKDIPLISAVDALVLLLWGFIVFNALFQRLIF